MTSGDQEVTAKVYLTFPTKKVGVLIILFLVN